MLFNVQFTEVITVINPISFSVDTQKGIQNHLQRNFVQRCNRGYYIQRIVSLDSYTDPRVLANAGNSANIQVRFTAEAVSHVMGEATIVRVAKVHDHITIAHGDNGMLMQLEKHDQIYLKQDMVVPAVITKTSFPYLHDQYLASGRLLTPELALTVKIDNTAPAANDAGVQDVSAPKQDKKAAQRMPFLYTEPLRNYKQGDTVLVPPAGKGVMKATGEHSMLMHVDDVRHYDRLARHNMAVVAQWAGADDTGANKSLWQAYRNMRRY